jgi:hypothetical protein
MRDAHLRLPTTSDLPEAAARRTVRRIPVDLVLSGALLLIAVVGQSFIDPPEARDVRGYLGTWASLDEPVGRTLVFEPAQKACLDGVAMTWRLLRPTPSRIPAPPSLAIDLPDGRTLHVDRQGDGLVTRDGPTHTHWRRSPERS